MVAASVAAMTRKTFLSLLLASTALALLALPANAQGACLSDRDIQNAVASRQILPSDEVLRQAGIRPNQIVGKLRVCDQGGQLFYMVPVLQGGEAKTISLRAK